MRLLSIKLKNYRSYYGDHELTIAHSGKKNVTLIHGAMGAGKTKLFSSIQWCFYGEEEYDERGSVNKDIINAVALKDSLKNKESIVEVTVIFEHENKKYHAIRKFSAFNGSAETRTNFSLLCALPTGDFNSLTDPDLEMNSILSKDLRKYFMFDGENIQNYSKYGHETDIQRAIKGLLGFDDIERTMDALSRIDTQYNSDIRKITNSQELQAVIDDIERIRTRIANAEKQNLERDVEIKKGEALIQKLEKEQAAIGQVKEYVLRQDKLKDRLAVLQNSRVEHRETVGECTDKIYLTILDGVSKKVIDIYHSLELQGEIPSPIKAEFIRKIIDQGECICGRGLEKGKDNDQIDSLLHLLQKQNSDLDNLVTGLPLEAATIKNEADVIKINLIQKLKEIDNVDQEVSNVESQLKEISEYLKGSDVTDVAMKEREKEQATRLLSDQKATKVRLQVEVETLRAELKDIEKRKLKLLENESEANDLKRYQEYTKTIIEMLRDLYKIYEEETKNKVRVNTLEVFSRFMWKKDFYTEVVIHDNYVIDILDKNKRHAREGLSAGERQCFSLAFVIALANVTGKDAPFIVDTPLGRISKDPGEVVDPRVQILKALPELLPQVILFVTYEEVRPGDESEKVIAQAVGAEYSLEYDSSNGSTRIVKIK